MAAVVTLFFLSFPFALGIASSLRTAHLLSGPHTGSGSAGSRGGDFPLRGLWEAVCPTGPSSASSASASASASQRRGAAGPYEARAAALLSLGLSLPPLAAMAAGVYLLPAQLASLFTSDADVQLRLAGAAPLLAAFSVFYGLQGVVQGALRGAGKQAEIAGFTLLSLWGVGLPTGWYMAFWARPTFGFEGLWGGLLLGMACLCAVLLLLLLLVDWPREGRRARRRADLRDPVPAPASASASAPAPAPASDQDDGAEAGGGASRGGGGLSSPVHWPMVGLPQVRASLSPLLSAPSSPSSPFSLSPSLSRSPSLSPILSPLISPALPPCTQHTPYAPPSPR